MNSTKLTTEPITYKKTIDQHEDQLQSDGRHENGSGKRFGKTMKSLSLLLQHLVLVHWGKIWPFLVIFTALYFSNLRILNVTMSQQKGNLKEQN